MDRHPGENRYSNLMWRAERYRYRRGVTAPKGLLPRQGSLIFTPESFIPCRYRYRRFLSRYADPTRIPGPARRLTSFEAGAEPIFID